MEMDPIIAVELIIFVLLLGLSGFFSGSETAFFSLNRSQLEQMKLEQNPMVERIIRLLNEPRRLIVTILIGNELVNVSASVISASLVIQLMGGEDKWWVNIFIMLPILLLFGEITPKTIALKNNIPFASRATPLLEMFAKYISPLRVVVRFVADGLTTMIIGKERSKGNIVTEDMVRTLVDHAAGLGALDSVEQKFINNIFDFGNQTVQDLMTPRSNFLAFSIDTPVKDILETVKDTNFTRVPIYRSHEDAVIGILHIRDLMDPSIDRNSLDAKSLRPLLRQPIFVPATKLVTDLFFMLRKRKRSFAMVLDEYGGIIGLITIDDMLATIFGSLTPKEGMSETAEVSENGDQLIIIKGDLLVSGFNNKIGSNFSTNVAETMGGWLLHHFGELPPQGVSIPIEGWLFTVDKITNNRITKISCRREGPESKEVAVEATVKKA
ncbi:MAG: HlyC/CorC family transporter [Magnetococcales bacterium]|nr:HlyC/CorC family transporter [Magnetococcales bacterium]